MELLLMEWQPEAEIEATAFLGRIQLGGRVSGGGNDGLDMNTSQCTKTQGKLSRQPEAKKRSGGRRCHECVAQLRPETGCTESPLGIRYGGICG